MQKHVNLVDLVKSFPTNIFSQNLASIQKRTSPLKFDHLAEKSEKGSISNLSTKVLAARLAAGQQIRQEEGVPWPCATDTVHLLQRQNCKTSPRALYFDTGEWMPTTAIPIFEHFRMTSYISTLVLPVAPH